MANIWLQAARPRTWIASISPAWIGGACAYAEGNFHPWLWIATLFTGVAIQIMINLSNDYFDFFRGADTPARKGPVRVTQAGLVSHSSMKKAICIFLGCSVFLSLPLIYSGGWPIALLFSIYVLLGLGYTAGPMPLAYVGLGDLCVLTLFGPVATLITYHLQTKNFSCRALCAGIGVGLISSAILMVNNLRDIDEDRKANKKTLVVRLGVKTGTILYALELIIALAIPCLQGFFLPLICAPFIYLLIKKCRLHENYNTLLHKTGAFLLVYTLIYTYALIF